MYVNLYLFIYCCVRSLGFTIWTINFGCQYKFVQYLDPRCLCIGERDALLNLLAWANRIADICLEIQNQSALSHFMRPADNSICWPQKKDPFIVLLGPAVSFSIPVVTVFDSSTLKLIKAFILLDVLRKRGKLKHKCLFRFDYRTLPNTVLACFIFRRFRRMKISAIDIFRAELRAILARAS